MQKIHIKKYQFLIKERESKGLKYFNNPKAFIEYSNDMHRIIESKKKKLKILMVFDYMIADMINNKKLNSVVTELFTRGRKLNISLFFIT